MKFFSIGRFIYPFSVEDAEDGYFELEYETGVIVLEAWARGIVFQDNGVYVNDPVAVAKVQDMWVHAVSEHPYFKQKNEDSQTAQADADKAFYERLSTVSFGKHVARKGDKIEILPTIEG